MKINGPGRIPCHRVLCAGLSAIVLGVAAASAAVADDFSLISAKGYASLGTFSNDNSLKIRLDGDTSGGDEVSWSDTFGKGEKTRFRFDGVWRFSERHHLRAMYTDYSLSRTETLDEDIQWGDDLILAGSSATGKLAFSVAELAYEYGFRRGDNLELALTAGIHYTTFEAKLTADVQTPGGGVSDQLGGKASVGAPLPVFGARALWHLGGNFYLDAMAQWFALSIDQYDGSLVNYRAALLWQPKKWVGLGVGYDSFNVDVDVDKDTFRGTLDWTYEGPQVFFNFGF